MATETQEETASETNEVENKDAESNTAKSESTASIDSKDVAKEATNDGKKEEENKTDEASNASTTNESSKDTTIAEGLSDKDIVMNFSSIEDLCAGWSSKVIALDLTGDRVVKGLNTFVSYGIYEGYSLSLATAVESLTATITEVTATIKNNAETQQEVDNDYSKDSSSGGYYRSSYGGGSGSNSNSSSDTTVNNNNEKDEITAGDISKIATINDYVELSTLLSSITSDKNSSLDEVLENFDETVIKKNILESTNLNNDLKKILYNLDSKVLKSLLIELYKNGSIQEFDNVGIEYLGEYVERAALRNNVSVSELITNSANKELLYDEVGNYETAIKLLDSKETIELAKDIYDGNDISNVKSGVISAVRDVIDMIADKNKVTADELLISQNKLNDASSSKGFISSLKGSSNMQNILKGIYIKG